MLRLILAQPFPRLLLLFLLTLPMLNVRQQRMQVKLQVLKLRELSTSLLLLLWLTVLIKRTTKRLWFMTLVVVPSTYLLLKWAMAFKKFWLLQVTTVWVATTLTRELWITSLQPSRQSKALTFLMIRWLCNV